MATLDKAEILGCQELGAAGRDRLPRIHPEHSPSAAGRDLANTTDSQLLASLTEAVALLQPAQQEIERLRTQLLEATEAHRKVANELAALKIRRAEPKAELSQSHPVPHGADIRRQALREEILKQEERRQRAWWRLGR